MDDLINRDALGVSLFHLGNKDAADIYRLIMDAPADNRWIPVEDALPEIDRDVLVYYPYWKDTPIQVAHLQYDGMYFELSDGEFYLPVKAVTHWMYLPEQPEKE